ncbi:uncharacterized protein PV09_00535 [Verruconis gallopava]|uniref:Uncharacterized protein n=1 Tax=Verruconis gallopava TaxID=253628 RepID=A0A0D2AQ07_9PEZI|nr:uncharacterized protein PV09_00535 [Verruconis gallopava]KIW08570.1 hypothetical protein PV09_00535 [Verruconis gallopava]
MVHSPAQTGYYQARSKYQFDLLDLCMFTNVHMGRAAATVLHNSRLKLKEWLRAREPSFLDFIPLLYPTSSLLRHAVDCVLARGRKLLCPDTQVADATIYAQYGMALQGLRQALHDKSRVLDADVLCSMEIMQLFEVLDFRESGSWTRHTSGISNLIAMRGPKMYRTTLERALLFSQLDTVFGEAMLQNKDCFLGDAEWQQTLREIMETDSPIVPPLLVGIWAMQARLPRLIRQTSELVLSGSCDTESAAIVNINLRRFREMSLRWRTWALRCANRFGQDSSKLPENLAIAYAGDIIANRALVALGPLHLKAASLEAETLELREKIVRTARQLQESAARGDALIARTLQVATMAEACHKDFSKAMNGDPGYVDENTGYVAPKVWQHFNGLMGRKVIPGHLDRETLLRELRQTGCWVSTTKQPEHYLDGTLWNNSISQIVDPVTLA